MVLPSLPDVCLLRIFSHVPLINLLHQIPFVCPRWCSLQPAALHARRSLCLFIGSDPLHLIHRSSFVMPFTCQGDTIVPYKHSDMSQLIFEELKPEKIDRILDTFVNVTNLEIAQRDIHSTAIDDVLQFLQRYWAKLVSLKLWLSYADEDVASQRVIIDKFTILMDTINGLPSLRHLTFYCRHQLVLPGLHQSALEMSIFKQLHSLQWFTFDSADELRPSLLEHGAPNVNLVDIELQNLISNNSLERLLLFDAPFARRFTNFDISFSSITFTQLRNFCHLFTSLSTLYIYLDNVSLAQYAQCLSELPRLLHLRLDINFEYYRPPTIHHLDCVTQLHSIQYLSMRVISTSHDDLGFLYPHWIFPSLRVVQIVNLNEQCDVNGCGYVYPDITTEQRKNCTRRLLGPFAKCQKLVKACALAGFVGDEQLEWRTNDLL